MSEEEAARVVESTVRRELAPFEGDVHVRKSIDDYGDYILKIFVVIKTKTRPDKRKMLGLARHIRDDLIDTALDGFPMVSFVSKADASKMNFETA